MKDDITGKKLKALREGADYSAEKIARFLDCEPEQVVQWENGESEPNLTQWMLMCTLYCITPDEMFSHINAEDFLDSDIQEEFHHEAAKNKLLRRCSYA